MSVRRLFGALCLSASVGSSVLVAQALPLKYPPRPTAAPITAADLMTRLYQFADDSMQGRAAGTEGHLRATAWIERELRRLGLQPAGEGGSFFQDVPMVRRGFSSTSILRVAGRSFRIGEDFLATAPRGARIVLPSQAPVVYGGIVGDTSSWIPAAEAAGKVVVLAPNPRAVQLGNRGMQVTADSRFASAALVVVPGLDGMSPPLRAAMQQSPVTLAASGGRLPPTLVVSNRLAESLLGKPLAEAEQGGGAEVEVGLTFVESPAPARNVVAKLAGSDARLRNEYVVLGAHSDHDPMLSRPVDHDSLRLFNIARAALQASLPPRQRVSGEQLAKLQREVETERRGRTSRADSIKNGADDDGSGSVALLELAEAFALAPARPKRSLLFVWHTAEELGLVGAGWYTEHPTVPLDAMVAQLNLDMVGRGGVGDIAGGGKDYVQLVGSRRLSTELGDLVERVNATQAEPFRFDYSLDADGHPERIYCRSDHARYARFGIPVTFFTTGLHPDYHQVTDEPQYIDYEKLARLTTLIRDVTLELANRNARVRLDKGKPDPAVPCRQ